MDLLKKRILQDGKYFDGGILKVDSFINHQMDPILMSAIGEEFATLFSASRANKIITIEASGIAPAIMTGYFMKLPVVFAKKKSPKTMENLIMTKVRSFTKNREYEVIISKEFLQAGDRVLFIDDFLAFGNAGLGIIDLVNQAGAEMVGMGFVIEKAFQNGKEKLKDCCEEIHSLAVVESLSDGKIVFK